MIYDVAVIGAGPAGLMAAKTAAENNLKAVVVERQKDVSRLRRACSQQLIMDEDYQKECIRIEPGRIIFTRNGFEVDYAGPTFNITDLYHISPGGHSVHFADKNQNPCAVKYDKARLLKGLWEKCEQAGVEIRSATVAYHARDDGNGVEVRLTSRGVKSSLKAQKVLVADGVNSRIAEVLGMNRGRTFLGAPRCMVYTLDGLKDFERTAWKLYQVGHPYKNRIPVIIEPSLEGPTVAEVITTGTKDKSPEQIYHDVTTHGPLADMFERAELLGKQGATLKLYTPIRVPYTGNGLVIGDAATFAEVEVQGALMCGYHGGNAVIKELTGEGGFEEYSKWWQDAFEFHRERELVSAVSMLFAAIIYTDDELDYLFSLVQGQVLDGTYNQWKQHKALWGAFLSQADQIKKARPELYEKLKKFQQMRETMTLKEIYASVSHS